MGHQVLQPILAARNALEGQGDKRHSIYNNEMALLSLRFRGTGIRNTWQSPFQALRSAMVHS